MFRNTLALYLIALCSSSVVLGLSAGAATPSVSNASTAPKSRSSPKMGPTPQTGPNPQNAFVRSPNSRAFLKGLGIGGVAGLGAGAAITSGILLDQDDDEKENERALPSPSQKVDIDDYKDDNDDDDWVIANQPSTKMNNNMAAKSQPYSRMVRDGPSSLDNQ